MWILLILSTYHYTNNVAVADVRGFGTKATCEEAGGLVTNAAAKQFGANGRLAIICVEQK